MTGTLTASTTRAITEAALFDASTSGNMDVYGDFSVVNLATNDSIAFTFKGCAVLVIGAPIGGAPIGGHSRPGHPSFRRR